MIIGNYLPKVKQNNTIGIRVVWTLQDERNWSATHAVENYGWHQVSYVCFAAFLEKTLLLWSCIL